MAGFKIVVVVLATILCHCVIGLHRPPPRYSQQYMPQTSFTCRNKIVGSYYADPETDCQLFHVCVSVAGSIQDYRFLCPNDTAFDQESQTCADWYDVDCEAATLYYASDNFDLYRLGTGLESLHYDNIRTDFEPQDHLQRSESNDAIRSPLISYNSNNYKNFETNKNNLPSRKNQHRSFSELEKDNNRHSEKKNETRKINQKLTDRSSQVPYTPKFNQVLSTQKPTSKNTITTKTTNLQNIHALYETTVKSNFNKVNNLNKLEVTTKTNVFNTNYPESRIYKDQLNQALTTTKQLPYDQKNNHSKSINKNVNNYNNIHRINNTIYSTSPIIHSKNHNNYVKNILTTNNYTPTTYSPATKEFSHSRPNKFTTLMSVTKSIQPIENDFTKAIKKLTYYKDSQSLESHNKSYQMEKHSAIGLGFSPSSINHLAENIGYTTPISRQGASLTTNNENIFNVNTPSPQGQLIQQRSMYYQNQLSNQYSTTEKYSKETTMRLKLTKKNDYDYAYYDNGPLEYDNIEIEHVTNNKESVKIT